MAVPQRKVSQARKNKRRAHLGLAAAKLMRCPRCNSAMMPHRICGNCGHYRGRQVIDREGL